MRRQDYRATLIVMVGLAAATLTGYLREAALADQLGAGRATDIYLIAFTVPDFILVGLPIILSAAFIPLLADVLQRAGKDAAWRFGRQTACALLVLLLGITGLVAWSAPLYLNWLAPGFTMIERAEAARVLRLMLPAICLMGGANLVSAALQVGRRFAFPALAAAVNNLAFVAVLLLLPMVWPAGRAAWGVTTGAALALLVQLPVLWANRPRRQQIEVGDVQLQSSPTVTDLARLAGPLAIGYAAHHAIFFVDRAMASTSGTGSVAALNYGYRLALVVGQLGGLAVATAVFPTMAEQAARKDYAGLRASLAGALRLVLTIGLPACVVLIVLREPIVKVVFERGAFGPSATVAVSDIVRWYAVAVLADALSQPLWRVVYVWRRASTVLAINGLQTGVRLVGNLVLISYLGVYGLALSAAIGLGVQLIVLAWLVRRRLGPYLNRGWWLSALRIVVAVACGLAVISLLNWGFPALPVLAGLLLSAGAGGMTYVTILWWLEKRYRR